MLCRNNLTALDIHRPAGMRLHENGFKILNVLRQRRDLQLQIFSFQLLELIQRWRLLGLWRLLCGRRRRGRGLHGLCGYGRSRGDCWGCGLLGLTEGCG